MASERARVGTILTHDPPVAACGHGRLRGGCLGASGRGICLWGAGVPMGVVLLSGPREGRTRKVDGGKEKPRMACQEGWRGGWC